MRGKGGKGKETGGGARLDKRLGERPCFFFLSVSFFGVRTSRAASGSSATPAASSIFFIHKPSFLKEPCTGTGMEDVQATASGGQAERRAVHAHTAPAASSPARAASRSPAGTAAPTDARTVAAVTSPAMTAARAAAATRAAEVGGFLGGI